MSAPVKEIITTLNRGNRWIKDYPENATVRVYVKVNANWDISEMIKKSNNAFEYRVNTNNRKRLAGLNIKSVFRL